MNTQVRSIIHYSAHEYPGPIHHPLFLQYSHPCANRAMPNAIANTFYFDTNGPPTFRLPSSCTCLSAPPETLLLLLRQRKPVRKRKSNPGRKPHTFDTKTRLSKTSSTRHRNVRIVRHMIHVLDLLFPPRRDFVLPSANVVHLSLLLHTPPTKTYATSPPTTASDDGRPSTY